MPIHPILIHPNTDSSKYRFTQMPIHPNTDSSKYRFIQISIHPNTDSSKYRFIQISIHPNTDSSKYRFIQISIHPNTDSPKYRLLLYVLHPLSTPFITCLLLLQLFNTTSFKRILIISLLCFFYPTPKNFKRHSLTCFIRKPMFKSIGVYIRSRFKLTRSNFKDVSTLHKSNLLSFNLS